MNASQHLREQIWDYVYGLLSDDESRALVDRIKSDPEAARMYAEVRLQADLVAQAARVREAALVIKGPRPEVVSAADAMVRGQAASPGAHVRLTARKVTNWLAAVAALALAALLAVGLYGPRPDEQRIAARWVAADLVGPRPMPAGLTTRVTLRTYTVAGKAESTAAITATGLIRLVDRDGRERLQQQITTDASGQAEVVLPGEALEPGVKLEVANLAPAMEDEQARGARAASPAAPPLVAELPIQAEPVMAYFLLAEPTVEPGKQVPFSAWNVTAFSAKPAQTEYAQAAVEAIGGAAVVQSPSPAAASEGVVSGVVQVPSDFAGGTLTLQTAEPQSSAEQTAAAGRTRAMQQAESYRFQSPLRRGQASPGEQEAIVRQRAQTMPRGGRGLAQARSQTADKALSTVAAGQPLKVAVPQELVGKSLWANAVCRGVSVASVAAEAGPAAAAKKEAQSAAAGDVLTLELPPEADGLIDVELYDRSSGEPQLVARTTVFREPQRQLRIEMPPPKMRFAPGEEVRLPVQVVDEQNRPAADTRLGVRVWNEELVQQAEEQPVLLADLVRNVPSDAVREAAQMQSGPAAAPLPAAGAEAKQGDRAGADLARGASLYGGAPLAGEATGPVELASNRVLVRAAVHAALAAAQQQRQQSVRRLGIAVIVISGVVLLVLSASAAARWLPRIWLTLPAAALAGASLVLGLVWMGSPPAPLRFELAVAKGAASAEPQAPATGSLADAYSVEPVPAPAAALADQPDERLARDDRQEQAALSDERRASLNAAASAKADPARREASAASGQRLAGGVGGEAVSGGLARQPLNLAGPTPPLPAIDASSQPSAPQAAPATAAGVPAREGNQQAAAPAALYFNPELVTDGAGRATVQFTMPPVPARYRVLVDALGQGRIGSSQQTLECSPLPAAEQPAK
jgi:hypothetical protein